MDVNALYILYPLGPRPFACKRGLFILTLIHLASKTIQDTWGGVKNTPLFQIALRLAEVVSEGNNHYK